MRKILILAALGSAAAGAAIWLLGGSSPPEIVLTDEVVLFSSLPGRGPGTCLTDWSWRCDRRVAEDGIHAKIGSWGGVAFRSPAGPLLPEQPTVGFLHVLLGPSSHLDCVSISFNYGDEEFPKNGMRLASSDVRVTRENNIVLVAVPLRAFRARAGRPVTKVNLMWKDEANGPIELHVIEVAFVPTETEADRLIGISPIPVGMTKRVEAVAAKQEQGL